MRERDDRAVLGREVLLDEGADVGRLHGLDGRQQLLQRVDLAGGRDGEPQRVGHARRRRQPQQQPIAHPRLHGRQPLRRQLPGGKVVEVPVDTFSGQGQESPSVAGSGKKPGTARPVPVPVRDPREVARAQEAARKRREAELDRLIQEHRRKVEAMQDDDLDTFWDRLKNKLGNRDR